MGIQGLLPLLKSIMEPIHIKDLKGCWVAVDTYSWLHKGALSCSKDLCKGTPTTRHIEYCMHKVNLLLHFGVKPILVFDGGFLPMKIEQENKRERSRKENLARAIEHESNGNSTAAYECYQKAVDISPSIAHELIQVLKQENISYMVAPYEADAQMTFLAISKHVEAVITEDSDLIPFGCPRIIYKMDKFGQGVEFRQSMLPKNKDISFAGFTQQMVLEMCILSGCDYLPSLPGMGLKRAHALIKRFKSYDKVVRHLRYSAVAVPTQYEESFEKAKLTFRHQRVYDHVAEKTVHLFDVPEDVADDLEFLGPSVPQQVGKGIALGDLDPFTHMPFKAESKICSPVLDRIMYPKTWRLEKERKRLDLPVQNNRLTKYFCFASLEAKRNFRAPRVSPKPPSPSDHNASSPQEHVTPDVSSCELKSSSESLIDSEKVENDSLGSNPMENRCISEDPEFSESQCHGRSTLETCQGLSKELANMDVLDKVEEQITTDNKKVVKRSRYFQHKQQNERNQDSRAKILVRDNLAIAVPENFSFKKNSVRDTTVNSMQNERSLEDSLFAKPDQLIDEPQPALQRKHGRMGVPHDFEGKTRTDNRKVAARSFYLQNEQKKESALETTPTKLLVRDDASVDVSENVITQAVFWKDNAFKSTTMKRKTSPNYDGDDMENVEPKQLRIDSSLHDNECCTIGLDEAPKDTKAKGKFGSDISHLGHYTGIAEKSMERFVSMLSLFKCNSSGSRASGLRAPLKDVRNT